MKRLFVLFAVAFASHGALAGPPLSAADEVAAFKAAGFKKVGRQWRSPCDDPGTPSYSPGAVSESRDMNGDGRPDAILTEGGTYCYGMTGQGYWLVSKQASGAWALMARGTGMVTLLPTKGAGGWPDIEVGGPGFCFPVVRWNGKQYRHHRHQYDGKPCRPN